MVKGKPAAVLLATTLLPDRDPLSYILANRWVMQHVEAEKKSLAVQVDSTVESNVPVRFLAGNDTKSGIPLDREKIDSIVLEASKGSNYYNYQQRHTKKIEERVAQLRAKMAATSAASYGLAERAVKDWAREREAQQRLDRTFVHFDMDAFYAAVEMRDNPALINVPLAIGGDSMISTANYEARKFGVVSGMPGYIAKQLCPQLLFFPLNFDKYRKVSEQVKEILKRYDPLVKSWSLDEACIDLSEYLERALPPQAPSAIMTEIRQQIFDVTKLTCSAGMAPNRLLAKMCSNINKPNGQFMLEPTKEAVLQFISAQPIKRICGVGKVMSSILFAALSITTCKELWEKRAWIYLLFSPLTRDFLLESALGLGSTARESYDQEEQRKSMSVERTFKPIAETSQMLLVLKELCEQLATDLSDQGLGGRVVGVKMKTSQFDVITRATTIKNSKVVSSASDLYQYSSAILEKHRPVDLRLLGVRVAGLASVDEIGEQPKLDRFFPTSASSFILFDSQTEQPELIQSESYSPCPVCGKILFTVDLAQINAHVDECLSKKYIGEYGMTMTPPEPLAGQTTKAPTKVSSKTLSKVSTKVPSKVVSNASSNVSSKVPSKRPSKRRPNTRPESDHHQSLDEFVTIKK